MILSPDTSAAAALALGGASLVAALAYAAVALTAPQPAESASASPRRQGLLLLAWAAHLLALVIDIAGIGLARPGARFGFAPALSMTVWLVLAVYMVESRFVPLQSSRRVLAGLAALAVLLALLFQGESRPQAASPWAPLHWVLGLASYGLFGTAVLHAVLLSRAERQLRQKPTAAKLATTAGTPGMPLLRLERLTFQFVAAGVAVLSLAILLGWWFTPHWRWDHKNLLALLGWIVLAGLLAGRRIFGWRGRRATRWLYVGAALLLLSYAGSRFVLEVVLQRGSPA
ncbi:cytochrome C assembly family protein [Roseateles violae]|uniref:Cytochrome c biogenesis protein CcsA n=1 Tax=Roseateles violae TaxID=3058042 RepID=A0ABT8DVI6_9BURK|nr:cytochrome c biogenesis protein CcsA [Pelomonas sp. PFR6]MDN3921060.1 cytochrome c biogenesis protein CcsA [Pelomonas sp. PFR6]